MVITIEEFRNLLHDKSISLGQIADIMHDAGFYAIEKDLRLSYDWEGTDFNRTWWLAASTPPITISEYYHKYLRDALDEIREWHEMEKGSFIGYRRKAE